MIVFATERVTPIHDLVDLRNHVAKQMDGWRTVHSATGAGAIAAIHHCTEKGYGFSLTSEPGKHYAVTRTS